MATKPKFVLTFLAIVTAVIVVSDFLPSRSRNALPSSATEILEYYKSSGFNDFERLLKARLPANDLEAYLKNLGIFKKFSGANDDAPIHWPAIASPPPEWWNPESDLSETYIEHETGKESYTESVPNMLIKS